MVSKINRNEQDGQALKEAVGYMQAKNQNSINQLNREFSMHQQDIENQLQKVMFQQHFDSSFSKQLLESMQVMKEQMMA